MKIYDWSDTPGGAGGGALEFTETIFNVNPMYSAYYPINDVNYIGASNRTFFKTGINSIVWQLEQQVFSFYGQYLFYVPYSMQGKVFKIDLKPNQKDNSARNIDEDIIGEIDVTSIGGYPADIEALTKDIFYLKSSQGKHFIGDFSDNTIVEFKLPQQLEYWSSDGEIICSGNFYVKINDLKNNPMGVTWETYKGFLKVYFEDGLYLEQCPKGTDFSNVFTYKWMKKGKELARMFSNTSIKLMIKWKTPKGFTFNNVESQSEMLLCEKHPFRVMTFFSNGVPLGFNGKIACFSQTNDKKYITFEV